MRHARHIAGPLLCLLAALTGGCAAGGSTITASPENWSEYLGDTVTVRGDAGNSNQGPIVRFADGGYIALFTREPWGFDERGRLLAGRPVEVTGKIVSGKGFRAEPFVLNMTSATFLPPGEPRGRSSPQAAP